MKGVVFTEFMEMVEAQAGLSMVDHLIESTDPPSGGAYTTVGTYDYSELVAMVVQLSEETQSPINELIRAFGGHLFCSFAKAYPEFVSDISDTLEMCAAIEGVIHVEVRKLYTDAELPTIEFNQVSEDVWRLDYRSTRPFADLCEGLLEACIAHFQDPLQMERLDVGDPENKCQATFELRRIQD